MLPCSHIFHSSCIRGWLVHKGMAAYCPLCKYVIQNGTPQRNNTHGIVSRVHTHSSGVELHETVLETSGVRQASNSSQNDVSNEVEVDNYTARVDSRRRTSHSGTSVRVAPHSSCSLAITEVQHLTTHPTASPTASSSSRNGHHARGRVRASSEADEDVHHARGRVRAASEPDEDGRNGSSSRGLQKNRGNAAATSCSSLRLSCAGENSSASTHHGTPDQSAVGSRSAATRNDVTHRAASENVENGCAREENGVTLPFSPSSSVSGAIFRGHGIVRAHTYEVPRSPVDRSDGSSSRSPGNSTPASPACPQRVSGSRGPLPEVTGLRDEDIPRHT